MITRCPFGEYCPTLPLRIFNPHTGKSLNHYGYVDTGAYECAIPAEFAFILGHNLTKGTLKSVGTGNGKAISFAHTTTIEIYHPQSAQLLERIENVPIDFMPNLPVILLGAKSFLSRFILTVDYPDKVFSIQKPTEGGRLP
jgi:hypothetical protein